MEENKEVVQEQEQTLKTGKFNKKIIRNIAMVLVVVLLTGGGLYLWNAGRYLTTDNAKVNADIRSVVPLSSGKIISWNVQVGDKIAENDIVGTLQNGAYLRSPISGEVVESTGTINQVVSPNLAVAKIADTEDIYVKANIEEKDILKIKNGQSVMVKMDAYKGKKFHGIIRSVGKVTQATLGGNPTSFSTSGTYTKVIQLIPVEIVLKESVDLTNIIGTNAKVSINIKAKPANAALTEEKSPGRSGNTTIAASGKIKSDNTKNITLEFPSIINTIYVMEGQKVGKDEPLVDLNISAFQQSILDKENSLKQGRLDLQVAMNNLNSQGIDLNQKQSEYSSIAQNDATVQLRQNEYNQAQEVLQRAQEDLKRYQELYEASAIAKVELEAKERIAQDAQTALSSKKIALENEITTRDQNLKKIKSGLSQESLSIENIKLNIQSQKEKLDTLERTIKQEKEKLAKTYIKGNTIISDVNNGIVQNMINSSGDSLPANAKLLSIIDLDTLKVDTYVPETSVKNVKTGDKAEISLVSDSTKKYQGRVKSIAGNSIEQNGETVVLVEVTLDNPDDELRPNYSVDVRINP